MPLLGSSEQFLVGYIAAKMNDLSILLSELESRNTFTRRELQNMRERVAAMDAAIRQQHAAICSSLVRLKVRQYEAMWNIAVDYLERRERSQGRPVDENEARRVARLRGPDLELYASDGRGPIPPVTTMVNKYRTADAEDLRHVLAERAKGGSQRDLDHPMTARGRLRPRRGEPTQEREPDQNEWSRDATVEPPLYGGVENLRSMATKRNRRRSSPADSMERPAMRRRSFSELSTTSESSVETPPPSDMRSTVSRSSISSRDMQSNVSRSNVSSRNSYVSTRQEECHRSVTAIDYPPMRTELPYLIQPNDEKLIGMTEIFVYPPNRAMAHLCPLCNEVHRLIHCTMFRGMTLLDRWLQALTLGVCLHCLRRGHSSFSCQVQGACYSCRKRHNSLLCPRRWGNQNTE